MTRMLRWPTREHTPFEKEMFNRKGRGLIQMGLYKYDNSSMIAAFSTALIKQLVQFQKKTGRRFIIMESNKVQVDGVKNNPTLVFDGSGTDWQAMDGLDITFTLPGDELIARCYVNASLSAAGGVMGLAFEVDGVVRSKDAIQTSNWTTAGDFRTIEAFMHIGAGTHRVRAMLVSANAITVTLTAAQRRMVLLGLAG